MNLVTQLVILVIVLALAIVGYFAWGSRRMVGRWVEPQQLQGRAVSLEEPDHERDEPLVAERGLHRGKPHEPVEPEVIRRELPRHAPRVAGLALELVGPPPRLALRHIGSALDDDLVALFGNRPERTVGVDEMEWVEAEVHDLVP